MKQINKVGFIGLGVMGFPMAGWLAKNGYDVMVYNRTLKKSIEWSNAFKGSYTEDLKILAQWADCIFLCVGNDQDVLTLTCGEQGLLQWMSVNSYLIDHTTVSAKTAQQVALNANQRHIYFMDAPISGGEIGAKNGKLTVMCGGDVSVYQQLKPVISSYAAYVGLIGQVGSGQLAKMVNQICIAGIIQGLSEGLYLAEKTGLDSKKVIDAISRGAAQSWQMDNRALTMLAGEYNHGFAVDWMEKDLTNCLEQAQDCNISLPLTQLVYQFYQELQQTGGGRWDVSSLFKRLEE